MPRSHIGMRKIRDALRLSLHEGLSLRDVAASLQMPFTTVGDHVRRAKAAGLGWPLPEGLDDDALEALLLSSAAPLAAQARPLPDWAKVHVELRRPHVTLMLLWLEHREVFPDGYAYSQFCEHYKRWRRVVDVVMRQEHRAGEKLFVDFPGSRIPIWDERTGEVVFEAELFVAVLGASSYLFAEAVRSQELLHWVAGHVHALEAIGGCPRIVVCDNLRSGVTRPNRYEPDVNATYQEMAAHYGVAVIPARSYKPRDKAKVEAGVLLAERWIIARLRNERFTSLGEANIEISRLVEWVNARLPSRSRRSTSRSNGPASVIHVEVPKLRRVTASICTGSRVLVHRSSRRPVAARRGHGALQQGARRCGQAGRRIRTARFGVAARRRSLVSKGASSRRASET